MALLGSDTCDPFETRKLVRIQEFSKWVGGGWGVLLQSFRSATCKKNQKLTKNRGDLDGGPHVACRFLRNANVTCRCRLFMAMSHVEFEK